MGSPKVLTIWRAASKGFVPGVLFDCRASFPRLARPALPKQLRYRSARHDPRRAGGKVFVMGVGGNDEGVEQRRRPVAVRDRVGERVGRLFVGPSVTRTRRHT